MNAAIQIYRPSELLPPETTAPAEATVGEYFRQAIRPDLIAAGRTANTVGEYDRAVARWEACWKDYASEYGTVSPLLTTCRKWHLAAFQTWLLMRGFGGRTVNKHLTHVRAILGGSDEVGRIPDVRPVPARRAAPKLYFSRDQVSDIFTACRVATWPRARRDGRPADYAPADGWQAAIVVWFNYGLRTQELISTGRDRQELLWSALTANRANPSPGGQTSSEFGWLVYTPQKQQRAKPAPLVLPLNAATRRHLERIGFTANAGRHGAAVFDWPRNRRAFYGQWRAILAAAGIEPIRISAAESIELTPKHLRKTCETYLDMIDPGVGPMVCGHAPREMAYRNYISTEARVAAALTSLAQPAAFERDQSE